MTAGSDHREEKSSIEIDKKESRKMVRFISVIRSGFLVAVLSTLLLTDVAGAQMRVIKPSGNLGVKVGHPSTVSLYDVPVSWTNERD